MEKDFGTNRKINGYVYSFYGSFYSKDSALEEAKQIRGGSLYVRIVPIYGHYKIYTRLKS